MKFPTLLRVAVQYLFRYRRRYLFLFLALAFGFGIVTFISSVRDGMTENLYFSAQSHYSGDLVVQGDNSEYKRSFHLSESETEAILGAARRAGIKARHVSVRSNIYSAGALYFNGATVPLKYVQGLDFGSEAPYLSELSFEGGGLPATDEDSILISQPVAARLGIQPGDSVILELSPQDYPKNTGTFIVAGIIKDSSIFGYYKGYISRKALNHLIGFNESDCSFVGFTLRNHNAAEAEREKLQKELEGLLPLAPIVRDRQEYDVERHKAWTGLKVYLLTMPVFLSEVTELLDAIKILTILLYIMMLIIILVSAAVTYRLILRERTREIGTMRAIGFYETDVQAILVFEALALSLVSLASGFVFAGILALLLSRISFAWFPGFEIFLKDGRLTALFLPETSLLNIAAVFCMLVPAIWFLSFRVTRNQLPLLLSGEAT